MTPAEQRALQALDRFIDENRSDLRAVYAIGAKRLLRLSRHIVARICGGLPRSQWAERYLAGDSSITIARQAGASHQTVLNHLRAIGIPVRPPGRRLGVKQRGRPRPAWHQQAAEMRAQGMTQRVIAQAFGVSPQAVSLALLKQERAA